MREWMIGQGIVAYVFLGCLAVGIIAALVAAHGYRKLIHESELMSETQNRLLKYIRLKFGSYYKLNMRPQDTKALIRHYVYKYKIGFMNIRSWVKLSQLAGDVIVLSAIVCLIWQMGRQASVQQMVTMIGSGAAASGIIYVLHRIYNFSEKQSMLEWYLMDYLENFLRNKLETGEIPKMAYQPKENTRYTYKEDEKGREEAAASKIKTHSISKDDGRDAYFSRAQAEADEQIVRDILKEFL